MLYLWWTFYSCMEWNRFFHGTNSGGIVTICTIFTSYRKCKMNVSNGNRIRLVLVIDWSTPQIFLIYLLVVQESKNKHYDCKEVSRQMTALKTFLNKHLSHSSRRISVFFDMQSKQWLRLCGVFEQNDKKCRFYIYSEQLCRMG